MIESQQVLEWIAEGEAMGEIKGEVNALLRLLSKRFPPGPPEELRGAIRAATLEQLQRWFDLALDANSLESFRRAAAL
jgi:hypothetical protein